MPHQLPSNIPVRTATYRGDQTGIVEDRKIVGPDRRGIFWHPTHAEYNTETDTTRVVFRPVPKDVIERMLGGPDGVKAVRDALMHREFSSVEGLRP